jgi:hypothetical protein
LVYKVKRSNLYKAILPIIASVSFGRNGFIKSTPAANQPVDPGARLEDESEPGRRVVDGPAAAGLRKRQEPGAYPTKFTSICNYIYL